MMKTRKMLAFLSAITMTASACLPAVSVKAGDLSSEAAEAYKALVQNTTVAEQTGYSLHDLTGDGQDELIICTSQGHGGGEYAFYTYENGEAVPAFDDGEAQEAYTVWFKDDTQVLVMTAGTAAWTDIVFFEINGKTVTATDSVSKTQDTYYKDGDTSTEISEEEYNSILAKYGISGNLADAGYIHLGHDYELTDLSPFDTANEPSEPEESGLTEDEIKAIAEKHGMVDILEYHDFDGNGSKEAFAVIAEESTPNPEHIIKEVWFIDAEGNETQMPGDFNDLYIVSDPTYAECSDKHGFLGFDISALGSGWNTLIYGVKDNVPYELDLSRNTQGFYKKEDGTLYTTKNEFLPEGGHLYPEYALIYKDGQFTVSDTELTPEPSETTEPTTEKKEVDYDKVYSDFVYNDLLKDPGKADWDAFVTKNYDIKRVSGVVSTAIYDFEQDGVKELLVVTRDNIDSAEDEYNTKFTLHLYQADEDGNIRFLDEYTLPDEHPVTAADLPRTYTEAEMMISGNAVYEKARSAVYASDDTGTHYYNIIGVKDGKFTPYNLSTEYASVYDNNSLLYADKSVDTSSPSGTYDSASEASDDITQKLKDQRLNFNSASVSTVRTDLNEYVSLNIDVNPDVQLFSYVFPDYVENSTGNFNKQSLQSVMIEKLTSVNVTDSGNSKSSSSSSSSSKSSGSSSSSAGGSPKTGEALPIAAGVTAVGALTAVFFSKKKKN